MAAIREQLGGQTKGLKWGCCNRKTLKEGEDINTYFDD